MSRRKRFFDNAGFGNHCWECENSTDWKGEDGKCTIYGIKVTKYDSPNNICSVGRICKGKYTRKAVKHDRD